MFNCRFDKLQYTITSARYFKVISMSGFSSSAHAAMSLRYPPHGNDINQLYEKSAGVLGKGAYGTVYKGIDKNNPDRSVALKEIRIQLNSDEGLPMNALREIGLLKQLEKFNHPNIVRYEMHSCCCFYRYSAVILQY